MEMSNANHEKALTHIYVRDAQKAFLRACWRSGSDIYCGMCMRSTIEPVVGEVCPTCASTVERVMEVVRGGASLPAGKRGGKLIRTGEQQVQGGNRGLVLDFPASRRAGT